jgi:hypothetical protein
MGLLQYKKAGDYGVMPSGTRSGEGHYIYVKITQY